MEPVGKTPPGGEAAVRRGRGRRLPAPIDHIGRGGDVPVARAGAVEVLTGKPVEGGTVTVPPGQAVAVRSVGRRWVGSRTAAGGAFRRLSRGAVGAASASRRGRAGRRVVRVMKAPLDVGLRRGTPDVETGTMQAHGWAHAAQRAYEWSASVIAACSACRPAPGAPRSSASRPVAMSGPCWPIRLGSGISGTGPAARGHCPRPCAAGSSDAWRAVAV